MIRLPAAAQPYASLCLSSTRRRIPPAKLQRARELRHTATVAERSAWDLLRNRRMLGLKFRRQHVIDGLIADFYCAEQRLVLEIDGAIHEQVAQSEYDAARTTWLEATGLRVVRIRNEDLSRGKLTRLLQELVERPPSPRRGEGDRG